MPGQRLIGIVGPLGPAQLACLRSWRCSGYRTIFFHIGSRPIPRPLQGIATHYRYFSDQTNIDSALKEIYEQCRIMNVAGITVLAEQLALKLLAAWSLFGPSETEPYLNKPSVYELIESKQRQIHLATEVGLPVLPTSIVSRGYEGAFDFSRPVVLRPDIARLMRPLFKAHLVSSTDELMRFLDSLTEMNAQIVAQTFVSGPNLVIHGARAKDGRWDHHEAFLTEIKSGGLAVSITPQPIAPELLSACRRFEEKLDLRGVFHYDFVIDQQDGQAYFLEINPRLGGTTAKVYAAGYDEPGALVATFSASDELPRTPLTQRRSAVSRIALVRHLRSCLAGNATALDYPIASTPPLALSFRTFLAYRDEVFSLSDLTGNLAYLSQTG